MTRIVEIPRSLKALARRLVTADDVLSSAAQAGVTKARETLYRRCQEAGIERGMIDNYIEDLRATRRFVGPDRF